ncbi:sulfotransferase family protein [Marinococcus halotolerans]|uniref:sulfotransferase family protein n=1 Tax=Marinococcus halotolerans TaxID=301092 RepID=UPI0003B5A383|nr:sulfotransferase [Marinococcus halotolerans]
MKPNFIIVGASKAGTTSLHHYLSQHSDILMSNPKETHFFEVESDEKSYDYYIKKYFKNWNGEKAVGEATPSYLYVPFVPKKIHQFNPEMKLIIILRNPTQRAFSAWWMHRQKGRENLSFKSAIENNFNRINKENTFVGEKGKENWKNNFEALKQNKILYRTYIDMGYYSEQLLNYMHYFEKNQMHIILLEDLISDPEKELREIFEFLGVDKNEKIDVNKKNESLSRSAFPIYRLVGTKNVQKIAKVLPSKLKKVLIIFLRGKSKTVNIDEETKTKLEKHYYKYNQTLEKLLDRELKNWSKGKDKNEN